jgi:hypothetical protein
MSVYSIWESEFPSDDREEGVEVTRAIWRDMPGFDGYLAHEIVEDLDQPGHLIVVSREAADSALSYLSHPNAQRANTLAVGARKRTVARMIDPRDVA